MSSYDIASIEACMDYMVSELGRLYVPQEASLFGLLSQCLAKFNDTFAIDDRQGVLSGPSGLERILNSIFDTDSRAFVTDKSLRILAGLDDHDKACLLVQAVAGMALVFRRLASASADLTPRLFSRELQLFAESEQRRSMLEQVGGTSLFSSCYTRSVMVDFLAAVVEERETAHNEVPSANFVTEDFLSDNVASERPCKNMGLPWGFTIMAIN
ncbi:hypothetical protein B0T26DRAFT_345204 [Lasiosphaeria miniovina]|uniref:Uncharacterized protein n=1 Tax=Lasiosphaeria miniovina TaxID=1954250 RepID=A0AA40ABA8_9PEZI|nr:uncharacterized protein B0T26DRAFT_345204 [Lasiosphaeria miniovina]KAK0712785.1 hypothetical protein B0T26DRAFT_345204 [Lasiosphaeria miniovina]